ncbi:MAG: AEC family transporter [Lachnospiraceae bacterium]
MDIFIVAQQMIMLFAMICVGILLTRLNWITPEVSSKLSTITVYLFNPFLTIDSVIGQSIKSTGSLFWQNLALVFLFYIVLFVAGWIIIFLIHPEKSDADKYRMLTLFPNCGFMGIPVVSSLLGKQYVIYVAIYMLIYNVIIYTYGVHLVLHSCDAYAEGQNKKSMKSLAKTLLLNPGLISSAIALAIFFGDIRIPNVISSFCTYMGNPCIPVSMLLIGYSVATADFARIVKNVRMYFYIALRMLALPILCSLLVSLLPLDETMKRVFLILISMPAGSMTAIIAQEYGGDNKFMAGGIVLTTIASLITLPVVSIFF